MSSISLTYFLKSMFFFKRGLGDFISDYDAFSHVCYEPLRQKAYLRTCTPGKDSD